MTLSDPELGKIVRDDLSYLTEEWHPQVTDNVLRITSTILDRLLIEGLLQRAWRATGFPGQPSILAPDFDAMLGTIDTNHLLYAMAGGAFSTGKGFPNGVEARFSVVCEGDSIPLVVSKEHAKSVALSDHPFRVTEYIEAPFAFARGHRIKRRQLIQYIRNKRGGAHYDPRRHPDRERVFRLLDEVDSRFVMDGRPGVFFEFLGLGQQVSDSEDVKSLLAVMGKV